MVPILILPLRNLIKKSLDKDKGGVNIKFPEITFNNYLKSSLSFFAIISFLLIFFWHQPPVREPLANITIPILNFIIMVILYFAVIKSKEYNKTSFAAWRMILISQIFLFCLDIIWLTSNFKFGFSENFAIILVFYSIHVILFSVGLLMLPGPRMQRIQRLRRMADIGLVMSIIFIALWILVVDRIVKLDSTDQFTLFVTIIFVILEFIFCYIIIAVFLRNAGQLKDSPVSFLLIAALLQAISTAIFGYMSVGEVYVAGGISDILMIGSYILIGAAGFLQTTQKQPKRFHDCSSKAWYMNLYLNYQIPALLVFLIYILMIWTFIYNSRIFLDMLLICGVPITLVIIRQILQMEEIRRSEKIANINRKIAEDATLTAQENLKIAQDNERKFRAIIDNSIDAIVITTEDGKIAHWNKGAQGIYGYSAEEAIGQDIQFIIPPRVLKTYLKGLEKVISSGTFKDQIYETYGLRKDGKEVPLEESVTQWQGENGTVFAAIIRDVSERKIVENELKRSLDEKNVLLMEIHHRVKNHLQIISSMISLISFSLSDDKTRTILLEIQNRVRTIALIHEILYQSRHMSRINMKQYIGDILKNLYQTYNNSSQNIKLISHIDEIYLNMDMATPCGLIINELVTNSLKYAFMDDSGEICVKLTENEGFLYLTITDNGVGIPEDIDLLSTKTLGLRLVNNLVRQINGEISLNRISGTKFKIIFKEVDYEDRI